MSVFSVGSWLTLIPVVHGSAAYAIALRQELLSRPFDALAVPLPESFEQEVLRGVDRLPALSAVVRLSAPEEDSESMARRGTYVPIDPCQGVIAAIRLALGERKAIEWIDSEGDEIQNHAPVFADCYAIRHTTLERFCSAMIPAIPPLSSGLGSGQLVQRIDAMASRLIAMRTKYRWITALCPLEAWPWLREAICKKLETPADRSQELPEQTEESFYAPELYGVDPRSYLFLLGELHLSLGWSRGLARNFKKTIRLLPRGSKSYLSLRGAVIVRNWETEPDRFLPC